MAIDGRLGRHTPGTRASGFLAERNLGADDWNRGVSDGRDEASEESGPIDGADQREVSVMYQYTVRGRVVTLPIDESTVAVRFREPAPEAMRATHATRLSVGPFASRVELPGEKFTLFQPGLAPGGASRVATGALAAAPEVARVAPVFRVGATQILATDPCHLSGNAPVSVRHRLSSANSREWEGPQCGGSPMVQFHAGASARQLSQRLEESWIQPFSSAVDVFSCSQGLHWHRLPCMPQPGMGGQRDLLV